MTSEERPQVQNKKKKQTPKQKQKQNKIWRLSVMRQWKTGVETGTAG